mmetsp:Transcript_113826/g.321923  ORF Transcript_113826/g.321923 Transcript_113826/m.321923 type:complete len:414 (+) Transcript_113826:196-1437(+)
MASPSPLPLLWRPLGLGFQLPGARALCAAIVLVSAASGDDANSRRSDGRMSLLRSASPADAVPRRPGGIIRREALAPTLAVPPSPEPAATTLGALVVAPRGQLLETGATNKDALEPVRASGNTLASKDCIWHQWHGWDACSKSCGVGLKVRTRGREGPVGQGQLCSGLNRETVNCNHFPCPVDCVYTQWSPWHRCPSPCWTKTTRLFAIRTRRKQHSALYGGKECTAFTDEYKACTTSKAHCVYDCRWSAWSAFSECSVTCGFHGGLQFRQRWVISQSYNGGKLCSGEMVEKKVCNKRHCDIDCAWHAWQEWGRCTSTCGDGVRLRVRDMMWEAKFNGLCRGTGVMRGRCRNAACPEDCEWSDWGSWGGCSHLCGGGERKKVRESRGPFNGGGPCEGEKEWTEVCNMHPCKPS